MVQYRINVYILDFAGGVAKLIVVVWANWVVLEKENVNVSVIGLIVVG